MSRPTPKGMEECPKCDPASPECDEDGRPYACYCCGDTGWVPEGTTASMQAEAQREADEAAVALGWRNAAEFEAHQRQREAQRVEDRRVLAAFYAARPRPMPASMDDDIPF